MSSIYTLNTPLVVKNNMQVDGTCTFLNPVNFGNQINIGSSGSIAYSPTGLIFNSDLIPSTNTLSIGTINNPWKSIYISTGTVFIGPTGALQINNNGLISSLEGFTAPYFQVGATNPGAGILLTEQNNLLYFQNQLGVVGPVSVFNSSTINPNNTYYSLTGNVGFGVTGPQQKIDVLGNIQASNTVFATNFTGTNVSSNSTISNTVTTNKIIFDNVGSIYFQTGSATGCFIDGILNSTGSCNLCYEPITKSVTYTRPNYLYAYYNGIQTGSATSFTGVLFNQVPILDGFTHTTNSSSFTFTADTNGIYQISYSLEVHNNNNASESLTAYIDLDGTPIAGSARSIELNSSTVNEATLSNLVLTNITSGTHTIQILARSSNVTRISLNNPTNVAAPGLAGSSASITIHRII